MTEIATIPQSGAALAEQVVVKGNLSALSEDDRMRYYTAVCESLGLNPLTRPFEYILLNNKLTLYATRAATDQLRAIKGITITSLDPRQVGELFVVVATGRDRTGREDSSTGAVSVGGLRGEALANAMMKAETKAKRRLTLSLAGLGMTDETEVDSIPGAQRVEQDAPLTLAERAAAKAAIVEPTPQEAASEPSVVTETAEAALVSEAAPAPTGQGQPEAAGASSGNGGGAEPTPEPAAEPPAPLSKQQFVGRLASSPIDRNHASALRLVMFPDINAELTDAQRGELWAALEAEQVASA